jgi:predicted nucleotidyltransferase
MEDFSAFTEGERALLQALNRHGVRFMLVGLSAAVLQGANAATRDIDLWFESTSDPRIGKAVREAAGIWISGSFGASPPQIGGDSIGDRIDVVTNMDGLGTFEKEYANAIAIEVDGIALRALPLARVIASKRASDRNKDRAALPALEEALAVIDGSPRKKSRPRRARQRTKR